MIGLSLMTKQYRRNAGGQDQKSCGITVFARSYSRSPVRPRQHRVNAKSKVNKILQNWHCSCLYIAELVVGAKVPSRWASTLLSPIESIGKTRSARPYLLDTYQNRVILNTAVN